VYLSVDQSSGGRLFQSVDGGVTWGDKTGSLPTGIRRAVPGDRFHYEHVSTSEPITVCMHTRWRHVLGTRSVWACPASAVYDAHIDALNGWIVVGHSWSRNVESVASAARPPPLVPSLPTDLSRIAIPNARTTNSIAAHAASEEEHRSRTAHSR
jgi:hypothetical protein